MKRFVTPGLAVLLLLGAFALVPHTRVQGQSAGLVSAVLSKLERNHQTLKSLRANIVMEKYDSRIRETDRYYGSVLYLPGTGKNASVRLDWSKPRREILSVANGRYTLYRVSLGVVYTGPASGNRDNELLSMMSMSSDELHRQFQPFQDVREETLWGGVSTTHLKLVPRYARSFKHAEIWVDSSGMPVQTKVVEKNDDATTIRLNNVEKNAKISAGDIPVKYDSNVKVIKG